MSERDRVIAEGHERNARRNSERAQRAQRTQAEQAIARREQSRDDAAAPVVPVLDAAVELRLRAAEVARDRGLTLTEAAKTSACAVELAALLRGASPRRRRA